MLYQIEECKIKRKRRLAIIYILIILLVLGISCYLGMIMAKKTKLSEEENINLKNELSNNEDKNNIKNQNGELNNNSGNNTIINKQENEEFVKKVLNIYNGQEGKRVFLTFDDGPSKNITPHILDILKENEIKATFFVLGNRVILNPELVKREYEEGHYIANHGYSHKYSKIYANPDEILKEYNKTEEEIRKAIGNSEYSSNLFRFPGGSMGGEYSKIKKQGIQELKSKNIAYLDWNALTNDANGANTKEEIMDNLRKTVGNMNNVVILMHDAPDKKLTYETLNDVIKYLKEKGYVFKNMYDL